MHKLKEALKQGFKWGSYSALVAGLVFMGATTGVDWQLALLASVTYGVFMGIIGGIMGSELTPTGHTSTATT